MVMAKSPNPEDPWASDSHIAGKSTEWLLIDPDGKDRFGHEGETVICGAGEKWTHLHRPDGPAPDAELDDEEELPWQVIYIGDWGMVRNLRYFIKFLFNFYSTCPTSSYRPKK